MVADPDTMVHPHIKSAKSIRWLKDIFEKYHMGRKMHRGRMTVIPPVGPIMLPPPLSYAMPLQIKPSWFQWENYITSECVKAESIVKAMEASGTGVRTANDIVVIRKANTAHNSAR